MFSHDKRLQYTVRVSSTNPGLANLMLEQFGGPMGELSSACRYFTQALGEDDPGRKDLLMDIATEELSHLEVIGTVVAMLNKGAKGRLAEGVEAEADIYRSITGAGNDSHITQILYGGGPPLTNSAGVPFTGAYIDTIGEPTADLRSNIASEARAKIVYERLINLTDDPGVKDVLTFLMTREIAHQKSFEKALYAIEGNFPVGKTGGDPRFTHKYFNLSQSRGPEALPDMRGSWNQGEQWQYVSNTDEMAAVDGGSGLPSVNLQPAEMEAVQKMAARGMSNPAVDPTTGAELGLADISQLNDPVGAADAKNEKSAQMSAMLGGDSGMSPSMHPTINSAASSGLKLGTMPAALQGAMPGTKQAETQEVEKITF